MKKCNECGQIINREMFINDREKRFRKTKKIYNPGLEILNKMMKQIQEALLNNPEKIQTLTDNLVNELNKNKKQI